MTTPTYNPSLKQVPRSAMAPILPSSGESSILAWLESAGRLRPREDAVETPSKDEPDNEEISRLMGTEDSYEEEDDLSVDDDD
ncbi:hypothetical protein C7271_02155 [filamentous cyanobacterium CCP5]|nr:hypothetical protein C7293_31335 [filamentous cyanobacterium CCT1]PSN20436.1 hypothetical protein C7271_02155 [filamentous cyanobacterium CCP5]